MIMRDVNYGWAVRYTHANTASFFFIFVYALDSLSYIKLLSFYYFLYCPFFMLVSLNYLEALYLKSEAKTKEVIENFLNIIKPLPITIDSSSSKNQLNLQDNEF